jgi:hypothetical protein
MRQAHNSHSFNKPSNSIYFMTAITIGIPALTLIALIETNHAIEKGSSRLSQCSSCSRL